MISNNDGPYLKQSRSCSESQRSLCKVDLSAHATGCPLDGWLAVGTMAQGTWIHACASLAQHTYKVGKVKAKPVLGEVPNTHPHLDEP